MTTILVVDDNAATRKLVRFAFERLDFRVLEADAGAAALTRFGSEPVALVLQDLCLPDLDGFDLVRLLRALPGGAEVPILAFSGMLTAHDEARVSAAGFDDLISKPVEPSRLVQIVRGHLPDGRPTTPFGAGRRLILADDDAVQRRLAAFLLEAAGFDVIVARDGEEALAQARRNPPAVVVSDVLMPRLDGFSLCTEMRRDARLAQVPLLLLTNSYVEAADRALALKVGAWALVHRTPDLKDALALLAAALDGAPRPPRPAAPPEEVEAEHKQRMVRQLERQVTLNAGINQRCALLSAEMAVLKGVAEALASHDSTEDAVRRALAACFDAGGIALGALFLQEGAERRVVSFGFSEGWDHGDLARLWGEPAVLEAALRSGATVVLPGAGEAGRRLLERAGASSALITAVRHQRVSFGALLMMSTTGDLTSSDRIAFAEAVAAQISQALAMASAFTRQEASERASREQAALLRSILESIGDGVVVANQHGDFIQWNAAAADLVKPASFYGPDGATPLAPEHLPLARVLRGESVDGLELFVHPGGAPEGVWLSANGRPWRDEQGRTRGGVAVFRDVTLEKSTQSQLMVSDRMASVGLLAAGVAHEINNPLSALLANLEMIRADLEPGATRPVSRDMVADAIEAAERVRLIVRDLRIFSRQDQVEAGTVVINQVLDSCLRMAHNELRHRARVVKDYGPALSVAGTEARLGQVFLNLLVNAAQAIPEGNTPAHTVKVSTRQVGARLAVEVSDTGAGMPPETLRHLFTPFFTTKAPGEGTGLGLSICKRIVTAYGGELEVESEVGRGTTFRVWLPVAAPAPKASAPAAGPAPGPAVAAPRRRVLVVDDEELVGNAVKRVLRSHHDVVVARSVKAALDLLREGATFDLIFSDLMMPEQTGIDLFHALATLRPGLERRIVFLTGGAFTPATRAFLDRVPNARVDKPFLPAHLRALVDESPAAG
ncbi:MAG: response regulator [Archangium sp.]|nr:response regulator [Archangium sp.]